MGIVPDKSAFKARDKAMAPIRLTNADVLDQSALYGAASASHSGKTQGEGRFAASSLFIFGVFRASILTDRIKRAKDLL
jgi:hypothetical protein